MKKSFLSTLKILFILLNGYNRHSIKNFTRSILIALVIGIFGANTFTSCSDDSGGGDGNTEVALFSGTWVANGEREIVFTENAFNYKVSGITQYSGTFSTSGSTIIFNESSLGTASGNFSLTETTLTLSNHTWDSSVNGTYTKTSGGGVSSSSGIVQSSSGGGSLSSSSAQPSSSSVASSSSVTGTQSSSSVVECSEGELSGTFTDERDNKSYNWVRICNQIWMAENLNYSAEGTIGLCCGETASSVTDVSNCNSYGRLYDWTTAVENQDLCPDGWHVPSDAEWDILVKYVDPNWSNMATGNIAGTKLKATSGWNDHATYGNGTDDFNFSALPGGSVKVGEEGYCTSVGASGNWWSASESAFSTGRRRTINSSSAYMSGDNSSKDYMYSVRCVKDNP